MGSVGRNSTAKSQILTMTTRVSSSGNLLVYTSLPNLWISICSWSISAARLFAYWRDYILHRTKPLALYHLHNQLVLWVIFNWPQLFHLLPHSSLFKTGVPFFPHFQTFPTCHLSILFMILSSLSELCNTAISDKVCFLG